MLGTRWDGDPSIPLPQAPEASEALSTEVVSRHVIEEEVGTHETRQKTTGFGEETYMFFVFFGGVGRKNIWKIDVTLVGGTENTVGVYMSWVLSGDSFGYSLDTWILCWGGRT